MKIVHAADLHLDSPLVGLEPYDGAPVAAVRGATRRAFENLVALCIEERAAVLLIAGDVFDGHWRDVSTGLFFVAQMARLREADVRVVWIRGNHDAAAAELARSIRVPENVRELDTRAPETIVWEDLGMAIHGQGYGSRAVTDDLAARYPIAVPSLLNIGLLHTALDGRRAHDAYAPTTAAALCNKGYDYWALGHVHAPEVVSESPWIVFAGCAQGRHIREAGAHGASVLTVRDGRVTSVQARPLDVIRWCTVEVPATTSSSVDAVLADAAHRMDQAVRDADGRMIALRVTVRSDPGAHATLRVNRATWRSQMRALTVDLGAGRVFLESVHVRHATHEAQPNAVTSTQASEILRAELARLRTAPDEARELLRSTFDELARTLPAEILTPGPDASVDDAAELAGIIDAAEELLLTELGPAERAT